MQLEKFESKEYKIGYARGNDGSESIVISAKPVEDKTWEQAVVSHAYHFEDRLELNRLTKIIEGIQEENEKYYDERCYLDDGFTAPDLNEDLVIFDEQAPVIFRDYDSVLSDPAKKSSPVPLHPSDYPRTLKLVKNGLIVKSEERVGNIESLDGLDVDNPDSRLMALTLATLQIGKPRGITYWDTLKD